MEWIILRGYNDGLICEHEAKKAILQLEHITSADREYILNRLNGPSFLFANGSQDSNRLTCAVLTAILLGHAALLLIYCFL